MAYILLKNKNIIPLHPVKKMIDVSWCNGSTTDFGSVCQGSNPCETTKKAVNYGSFFCTVLVKIFILTHLL